jgi:hypothetical protein
MAMTMMMTSVRKGMYVQALADSASMVGQATILILEVFNEEDEE